MSNLSRFHRDRRTQVNLPLKQTTTLLKYNLGLLIYILSLTVSFINYKELLN